MQSADWRTLIRRETARVEEDTLYAFKSHFNAAATWGHAHLYLGIPAATSAAIAGVSVLSHFPAEVAAGTAFASMAFAGLMTFLNARERAREHQNAGNSLKELNTRARTFRTVSLTRCSEGEAISELRQIHTDQARIARDAPRIPGRAYRRAKRGIEAGEAEYLADLKTAAT